MNRYEIVEEYYEKNGFGIICNVDKILKGIKDSNFLIIKNEIFKQQIKIFSRGYPFVVYYKYEFNKLVLVKLNEENKKNLEKSKSLFACYENNEIIFYKKYEKIKIGELSEENLKKVASLIFNKEVKEIFYLKHSGYFFSGLAFKAQGYIFSNLSSNECYELDGSKIRQRKSALGYVKNIQTKTELLEFLTRMNESLRDNGEFFIKLLSQWREREIFDFVSNKLKDNEYFISKIVEIDGMYLEFASNRIKKNKEIVLKAIKKNGLAFQFVNKHLKKDEELVFVSLKNNGLALEFVDEKYKNDKFFVLKAIQYAPYALKFANKKFRNDKDIETTIYNFYKEIFYDEEKVKKEILSLKNNLKGVE